MCLRRQNSFVACIMNRAELRYLIGLDRFGKIPIVSVRFEQVQIGWDKLGKMWASLDRFR